VSDIDPTGLRGANADGPIVLFGASYLAAWKLAEVAGRPVINRGIPGNQTLEYLERFDRDVADLHPRAVVIWGIDNDIIRAPREATDEACCRVERNLGLLLDRARANRIEPILVTDLTLRPPVRWYEGVAALAGRLRGKQGYQQRINAHVLHLNRCIRDLAQRTGTRLLDLHPLTADRRGMRKRAYAQRDGSHLTDEGYRVIDDYVRPRLEAWLGRVGSSAAAMALAIVAGA
jgi:lysophospholipase L1-like esterase